MCVTRVLQVMTATGNVLEMVFVSAKNARVILVTSERTVTHCVQDMDYVQTTAVFVKQSGRVNSVKFPSAQMTVQETVSATALFSLAFVTLDGGEMTAANLIALVNRIVITVAHAQ